ncbi:hypothetical protein BD414DRAFT_414338 [Trametes punicea]|nr:hypothetical protein BD414DRAFT_414338 [Trametes punicea]
MENFHCVQFADLAAAIQAVQPYDDGFMNYCLGNLHDNLRKTSGANVKLEDAIFLGLYRGHDLQLTLTHVAHDFAWQLGCPQGVYDSLSPPFLDVAAKQLAQSLLEIAHPNVLSKIFGHEGAVSAFLEAWTAAAATKGAQLRVGDPIFPSRSSYATRETVSPLPTSSSNFSLTPATEDKFEELLPLYLEFRNSTTGTRALHVEEAYIRDAIASGFAWTSRSEGSIVGFAILGRATPKTIALRNVYVAPEHRRKGIAEGMVGAITRFCLGIRPIGYEGLPDGPPAFGTKDVVCINVIDPAAERIYQRVGYLFPERTRDGLVMCGKDPVSGLTAWFPSVLRGVLLDSEAP